MSSTTSNTNTPRKIEQFRNMQEFLRAIHDAIDSHGKEYIANGRIHGNINVHTVYIGSPSPMSRRKGFIGYSNVTQHQFQSVNVLADKALLRKKTVVVDYLDDLESFYYIIAWISMAYTSPGVILHPSQYPTTLSNWFVPTARECALEKESMLQGTGFGGSLPLSTFSKPNISTDAVFEALLVEFHRILQENYHKKWSNTYRDPQEIYGRITQVLRWSIDALPQWA